MRRSPYTDIPKSDHAEIHRPMNRVTLITAIVLVAAPSAFAQSDEEIIEAIRTSIAETLLEQSPDTLPQSFKESGLAPSDKERLMLQLANDGAVCFTDSLIKYATLKGVPISDFVSETSEGEIQFEGVSGREFEHLWLPCILAVRQAAGLPE